MRDQMRQCRVSQCRASRSDRVRESRGFEDTELVSCWVVVVAVLSPDISTTHTHTNTILYHNMF